jgi:hypothetical protein
VFAAGGGDCRVRAAHWMVIGRADGAAIDVAVWCELFRACDGKGHAPLVVACATTNSAQRCRTTHLPPLHVRMKILLVVVFVVVFFLTLQQLEMFALLPRTAARRFVSLLRSPLASRASHAALLYQTPPLVHRSSRTFASIVRLFCTSFFVSHCGQTVERYQRLQTLQARIVEAKRDKDEAERDLDEAKARLKALEAAKASDVEIQRARDDVAGTRAAWTAAQQTYESVVTGAVGGARLVPFSFKPTSKRACRGR